MRCSGCGTQSMQGKRRSAGWGIYMQCCSNSIMLIHLWHVMLVELYFLQPVFRGSVTRHQVFTVLLVHAW